MFGSATTVAAAAAAASHADAVAKVEN